LPRAFSEACWKTFELKKISRILPVSEAAISALITAPQLMKEDERLILANRELLQLGMSKIAVFERALATGIRVARGRIFSSYEEAMSFNDIGWPRFIRTDNSTEADGRYQKGRHWMVSTPHEYDAVLKELMGRAERFLVQEHIRGRGCGAFVLLHEGEVILSHTHERLAEIPWTGGVSARRRLTFEWSLLERAETFLKGLSVSGLAMLEFRKGVVMSEPAREDSFLVEVNARPWGSLALARHAGIPFVAAWAARSSPEMQVIQHWQSSRPEMKERTRTITSTSVWPGEIQHLLSVLRSCHERELCLKDALSYFKKSIACLINPTTKYDFLCPRDLGPAVFQFVSLLSTIVTFARRRLQMFFHPRANAPEKEVTRFDQLLMKTKNKNRIALLFVCQGNRCRSPFAELLSKKILTDERYDIQSRGLSVSERSVPLRFHSIFHAFSLDPRTHVAMPLTADELHRADIIFTMNTVQKRHISKRFGSKLGEKCIDISAFTGSTQGIDDPYLLAPLEAKRVFNALSGICDQILGKIDRTAL
jgi:protein-tyrosine-phosphatase